jgi:hypothetical protein
MDERDRELADIEAIAAENKEHLDRAAAERVSLIDGGSREERAARNAEELMGDDGEDHHIPQDLMDLHFALEADGKTAADLAVWAEAVEPPKKKVPSKGATRSHPAGHQPNRTPNAAKQPAKKGPAKKRSPKKGPARPPRKGY